MILSVYWEFIEILFWNLDLWIHDHYDKCIICMWLVVPCFVHLVLKGKVVWLEICYDMCIRVLDAYGVWFFYQLIFRRMIMVTFSSFSCATSVAQCIVCCVASLFGGWTRLEPIHLWWNTVPCDPKNCLCGWESYMT